MLEGCDGHDDEGYPDGWFAADPETDANADPAYYAPDVVEEILSRPTDHEIATHTFTHVLCGEVDRATVETELSRAQRRHREMVGESTVSLVPPRHSEPPADVLRANGIEIVRLSRDTRGPTPVHRYKELLMDRSMTRQPAVEDGVVETYCTDYPSLTAPALPSGQKPGHVAFRGLPPRLRQRLHRRRLVATAESTAERDSYLHLWAHLWDLSNEYQLPPVEAFIAALDRCRSGTDLSVLTMAELNEHVREELDASGGRVTAR
jgi:hypothetical protein